ncbi:MAG: hypothetical protein J6M62_12105 [Selenomonadaceae bacterium]|nr:hypothetical protein [Selenomonadaceae bacterium]
MSLKESKKLSVENLEGVSGGTIVETVADSVELYKRGLLAKEYDGCAAVRDKLHGMGYGGYVDNGGVAKGNIYTDKNGQIITRQQFWKNFDAENGTKIIRSSQYDSLKDALGM